MLPLWRRRPATAAVGPPHTEYPVSLYYIERPGGGSGAVAGLA